MVNSFTDTGDYKRLLDRLTRIESKLDSLEIKFRNLEHQYHQHMPNVERETEDLKQRLKAFRDALN